MTVNELMNTLRMVTNQMLEVKVQIGDNICPMKDFEIKNTDFIIKVEEDE